MTPLLPPRWLPSRRAILRPLLGLLLLMGCGPGETADSAPPGPAAVDLADGGRDTPGALGPAGASSGGTQAEGGQIVYVPVYSHIYFQDEGREIDLAATLSVRNTDPDHPITITAVRYHDSDGRLVRRYGDTPVSLAPLASRAYVVAEGDRTGGVGANFTVAWETDAQVSPPVVEAVMISTASTQGISFVSRGRVVRPVGMAGDAP